MADSKFVITTREQVRDNMEVHGAEWTAAWMRKRKVPFTIAYWLAFGTAPRLSTMLPSLDMPAAKFYNVLYDRITSR